MAPNITTDGILAHTENRRALATFSNFDGATKKGADRPRQLPSVAIFQ
jgi:hypothetical protein